MVCLLVGEGDFSFALALAAQRGAANLVASCLLHGSLDVGARANVDRLSAMGVRVLTDVDARCLHEHPWVSHCCTELSEIVFNFPHVGGKMRIGDNRKLLRDFFLSAGRVLRPGSLVQVTLCRGQGGTPADSKVRRCPSDTWQVVEMAAPGGFILHRVVPFRAPAEYTPRGYRGGTKGFHTEGALTHVFCLVGSAVLVLPSASSSCAGQNIVASRLWCWVCHASQQNSTAAVVLNICLQWRKTRRLHQRLPLQQSCWCNPRILARAEVPVKRTLKTG
ncbi:ferredoxin-fold anticodon-binding domain-containing protein 1 homolog isoform X7 [Dermacentor variabilis]|uniref:ferredoxin-fold anticodon-binding domain-containing protein 1 homolog isoform X7 n=1 Tax=Dermacentor variabilis TaxID=34621 RepID=UPI003F5B661B